MAVAGCAAPTAGRCVYEVDTLQALRVYDYTDMTNTGTRIRANKPVSMVYGQDTEQGAERATRRPTRATSSTRRCRASSTRSSRSTSSRTRTTVPTAGGVVTYTLTLKSFDFGPLTNVTAFDLLPSQVVLADNAYVSGSTLITYPDLFQSTVDPTIDTRRGQRADARAAHLGPAPQPADRVLDEHQRDGDDPLPHQPARRARDARRRACSRTRRRASATFGGSAFNPTDTVDVVQTDAILFKASADDGSPAPGDLITYTLYVRNVGAVDEPNVIVTDAVPADTTFVAGPHHRRGGALHWRRRGRLPLVVELDPLGRRRRRHGERAAPGSAVAGTSLTLQRQRRHGDHRGGAQLGARACPSRSAARPRPTTAPSPSR